MPSWGDLSVEVIGGLIASGIITVGAVALGYLKRFKPDWRGWDWPAIADTTFYTLKCAAVGAVVIGMVLLGLSYRAISLGLQANPANATGAGSTAVASGGEGAADGGPSVQQRIDQWMDELQLTRRQVEPPPSGELMRVSIDFEKEVTHLALEDGTSTIRLEKIFSLTKPQSDWWASIPPDVKNEAIWSISSDVLTSGVRVRWAPRAGQPYLVLQKRLDFSLHNKNSLQRELELMSDAGRIVVTRFNQAFKADAAVRFPQLLKE